jgi:putative ABC transport system permease protein
MRPETGLAMFAAVLAAMLVTMASGIYPLRKAARLDPAEPLIEY